MTFFCVIFSVWDMIDFFFVQIQIIQFFLHWLRPVRRSPPPPKKIKIDPPAKKIQYWSYLENWESHKKKSFMQKMSARSIQIYPANFATFEESLIFGRTKRPFWTAVAAKRNMWYEISHQSFFLLIAHLFCQDGNFWGGGEDLHIFNCDRAVEVSYWQNSLSYPVRFNPVGHFPVRMHEISSGSFMSKQPISNSQFSLNHSRDIL